jgi:hypothetical protein
MSLNDVERNMGLVPAQAFVVREEVRMNEYGARHEGSWEDENKWARWDGLDDKHTVFCMP